MMRPSVAASHSSSRMLFSQQERIQQAEFHRLQQQELEGPDVVKGSKERAPRKELELSLRILEGSPVCSNLLK